jgi:hypothetical protein
MTRLPYLHVRNIIKQMTMRNRQGGTIFFQRLLDSQSKNNKIKTKRKDSNFNLWKNHHVEKKQEIYLTVLTRHVKKETYSWPRQLTSEINLLFRPRVCKTLRNIFVRIYLTRHNVNTMIEWAVLVYHPILKLVFKDYNYMYICRSWVQTLHKGSYDISRASHTRKVCYLIRAK